jgi:hypothetical protein
MIAVFVSHVGVHRLGVSSRALSAPLDIICPDLDLFQHDMF